MFNDSVSSESGASYSRKFFKNIEEITKYSDIDNLFDKFNSVIDKAIEAIEALEKTTEAIENNRDSFENAAIAVAMENFTDVALPIIIQESALAIKSTKEYNYEPYVTQFMGAVNENLDNIVKITKTPGGLLSIAVSFESLGSIDLWADAIKQARESLSIGKSRGQTKGATSDDSKRKKKSRPTKGEPETGDLASILWAYKYYKPAREGGTVQRWSNKLKAYVDKTASYLGKYEKTVMERLSYLSKDKAPYWYLIENGNAVTSGFDAASKDSFPYPVVEPTNFTDIIRRRLQTKANDLVEEANNAVTKLIEESYEKYGFKRKNRTWNDVKDGIGNEIEEMIFNGEITINKEIINSRQNFEEIYGDYRLELYLSPNGTLQLKARHMPTGTFRKIRDILIGI